MLMKRPNRTINDPIPDAEPPLRHFTPSEGYSVKRRYRAIPAPIEPPPLYARGGRAGFAAGGDADIPDDALPDVPANFADPASDYDFTPKALRPGFTPIPRRTATEDVSRDVTRAGNVAADVYRAGAGSLTTPDEAARPVTPGAVSGFSPTTRDDTDWQAGDEGRPREGTMGARGAGEEGRPTEGASVGRDPMEDRDTRSPTPPPVVENEAEDDRSTRAAFTPTPSATAGAPSFASETVTLERSGPDAVSRKGARGRYQVTDPTAADPGFGVIPARNSSADERDRVGVDYGDALDRYYGGNRVLGHAAYDAGPGRVDRWIKQFGDPRKGEISDADFAAKIPIAETRDYVNRYLAMKTGAAPTTATTSTAPTGFTPGSPTGPIEQHATSTDVPADTTVSAAVAPTAAVAAPARTSGFGGADLWMALAQAGFGMAASRNTQPLGAVAEGALHGLKSIGEQKAAALAQQKVDDERAWRADEVAAKKQDYALNLKRLDETARQHQQTIATTQRGQDLVHKDRSEIGASTIALRQAQAERDKLVANQETLLNWSQPDGKGGIERGVLHQFRNAPDKNWFDPGKSVQGKGGDAGLALYNERRAIWLGIPGHEQDLQGAADYAIGKKSGSDIEVRRSIEREVNQLHKSDLIDQDNPEEVKKQEQTKQAERVAMFNRVKFGYTTPPPDVDVSKAQPLLTELPSGAKQVGTSGGKAVYEAPGPDGKTVRWVEQ